MGKLKNFMDKVPTAGLIPSLMLPFGAAGLLAMKGMSEMGWTPRSRQLRQDEEYAKYGLESESPDIQTGRFSKWIWGDMYNAGEDAGSIFYDGSKSTGADYGGISGPSYEEPFESSDDMSPGIGYQSNIGYQPNMGYGPASNLGYQSGPDVSDNSLLGRMFAANNRY